MPERLTPSHAAYVMIFLAVLVVAVGAWSVHVLQNKVDDLERMDCFRDNVEHRAIRLALTNPNLASAESRRILEMPELSVRDCP